MPILIAGAGLSGLGASERQEPEPVQPDAPPPVQELARPGSAFSVNLGEEETLRFVWIAPMKMWVGKYEVSNGQLRRYDLSHDSTNVLGRDMDVDIQPVVHVSWEDSRNYCGWLNRHYGALIPTGFVFRLPAVQEWETYAACGEQRVYPWGNQWPPPNYCNYRGTEGSGFLYALFQREKFIRGHEDGYIVSAPITKSGANAWKLYGVGGNVWEWCADWADEKKITRAIRGAAWNDEQEKTLRIAHRAGATPANDNACIGVRVVIGPPLPVMATK